MQTLRKSSERGYANHGWLESYHSFSFAQYHDPAHMGVGNLRVINEDRIAPGTGFGMHGHSDMEIVSYVLSGALAHRDSMGTGEPLVQASQTSETSETSQTAGSAASSGVIAAGDVQRMSAGTGVRHSEFNHAPNQATHFLQIWILPHTQGMAPSYAQRHLPVASKRGRLALLAAPESPALNTKPDGGVANAASAAIGASPVNQSREAPALHINADARIYAGLFNGAESADFALNPARLGYVHLVRGALSVNGTRLEAGDALTLRGEASISLSHGEDAEVLVFDLKP